MYPQFWTKTQAVGPDLPRVAGPRAVTGLKAGLRSAVHLLAGSAPAALCGLAATAAVFIAAGDHITVVNGSVQFTVVNGPLLATVGVTLLVALAVTTWTAGVYAVIVAGCLLGRPVTAAAAIRRMAASWRSSAVLGLLAAAGIFAPFLAFTVLLTLWAALAGSPWRLLLALGFAVLTGLVLYLTRYVLAVPAAALEGLGAWQALGRARRMATGRGAPVFAAVIASAGFESLASWLLRLLVRAVVGVPWQPLASDAAQTLAAWLALLLAISVLTGCYLEQDRPGIPGVRRADLAVVAAQLPDPAPPGHRPLRAAAAALALLLPAALYAGYPLLRPVPQVSNHTVDPSEEPDLALTVTSGGNAVLAYNDDLIWCQDRDCDRHHTVPIRGGLIGLGVAALPGGAVAVTGWKYVSVGPDYAHRNDLAVVRCSPVGCGNISGAAVLRHGAEGDDDGFGAAAAAEPGGGLAIVNGASNSLQFYQQPWQLTFCRDVQCAAPRSVPLTTTDTIQDFYTSRVAAITMAPGGRPVAVVDAVDYGRLVIVTCRSAECTQPQVTSISSSRLPASTSDSDLGPSLSSRISVAATPRGIPVVALPAGAGTALVTCQNPACTTASVHRVPIGSPFSSPVVTIDQRGLPLVVAFDNGWITSAACPNLACSHPVIHQLVQAGPVPDGSLDITQGPDGVPRIAWDSWIPGGSFGQPNILVCDRGCS